MCVLASLALICAAGGRAGIPAKGPLPDPEAAALGRSTCSDLRGRIGAARFAGLFAKEKSCDLVMTQVAERGIVRCKGRHPAGSTAELYCVELAIQASPAERQAIAQGPAAVAAPPRSPGEAGSTGHRAGHDRGPHGAH
jgi:hypothetical protein